MGYYRNILSHNYRLCLCPSGPPTLYILKRLALREYCRFCIQPLLVPYGPTHPKKIKKIIKGPIQLSVRSDNILSRIDPLIIPEPMNSARGWLLFPILFNLGIDSLNVCILFSDPRFTFVVFFDLLLYL